MQRNVLTTALLVFCVTALFASPAHAEKKDPFYLVMEAEMLAGYSDIVGRDGTFSSIDSWLFSPTVKLSEDLTWINLYNGTFNRSAQVVNQEEGGRQTQTTQSHSLTTSLKYNVNENWSLRPLFFADWIFVNETEDEDFGEGLYDYEQLGGGIESTWTTLKTKDREDDLRFGFRYIDREYPNYQSLLSLFNPNGAVETNEKDLDGYKFNLSHRSRSKDSWSWGLEGIFFYKDYSDKKTIDTNGILTSNGREDFVEYVNAFVSHPLGSGWTFSLDGQVMFNESNLDFYDTHNTLTFTDDNFIRNYYDMFSFMVNPALTYSRPMGDDKRLLFTAGYSFYALHYPGRKVQDLNGVYGAEDQQDYVHTFSGKLSVPITSQISWVAMGSYTLADSNQKYEAFYLYDYDLWTAVTGISFKY